MSTLPPSALPGGFLGKGIILAGPLGIGLTNFGQTLPCLSIWGPICRSLIFVLGVRCFGVGTFLYFPAVKASPNGFGFLGTILGLNPGKGLFL